MIIKSRETKIPQKFTSTLFTLLNFNEIGCKQCYEKDQMASVFWYFQILYMNIREILFPRVKLFFPRNMKNPKSAKLNSHKNLLPHGFRRCGNCERFCFSYNLYPDFNSHAFGSCVNFSGKKVTAALPPPPHPPQVRKCPYAYVMLMLPATLKRIFK